MQQIQQNTTDSWLASFGLRLSNWFERWFPDAFALALTAVVIVFSAAAAVSGSPLRVAQSFGNGFWDLVTFTIQVALLVITGYVVAMSPPVHAAIRRMAAVPQPAKGPSRMSRCSRCCRRCCRGRSA